MKMSLVEIVREIMSDMSSDDISSISDTEESEQIARIVRSTYYEMIGHRNWPHLKRFRQLEAVSDSNYPTHFLLPDDIKELVFFNYDVSEYGDTDEDYQKMKWLEPEEFLRRANQLKSSDSTSTSVTDYSGARFLVRNDRVPMYYTSFDDRYVVLDAYPSGTNATLVTDRTQTAMYITPSWSMVDDFVPDLPVEAFPGFVAECKSTAFATLMQLPNEKEEQKSRRQSAWLSRRAWQANGGLRYPDYGRKGRRRFGQPFDKSSYKE